MYTDGQENTIMIVMRRFVCSPYKGVTHSLSCLVLKRQKSRGLPVRRENSEPVAGNSNPSHGSSYQKYYDMLDKRRKQAERSLLVEIPKLNQLTALKRVFGSVGRIGMSYLYRSHGKNLVLVEFLHIETKQAIMKQAQFPKDPQCIPVVSPFVYFQEVIKGQDIGSQGEIIDSTSDILCDDKEILKSIKNLNHLTNRRLQTEIEHLYNSTQISDLSSRLRFLTCHQLDVAFEGLFPKLQALPFGSSVCGFGRNSGDLDIYLNFRGNTYSKGSKLVFHYKSDPGEKKKMELKVMGDLIGVMLPGCVNVCNILSARVPIVKYHQSLTNLDCDVNTFSAAGIDISHILWLMKHWDPRVAPLVHTVRVWAEQNMVVPPKKPVGYMTNFSLMLMVIFYLQTQKILPSLISLQDLPAHITSPCLDPYLNIIFPDLRQLPDKHFSAGKANKNDVDALLVGFFEFYSNFNFSKDQISIYCGEALPRRNTRACLEIENPVEHMKNVTQNCNPGGLESFRKAAKSALRLLEGNYESHSLLDIVPLKDKQDPRQRPDASRKG